MLWVREALGLGSGGNGDLLLGQRCPESLKVALPAGVALAAGLHLAWFNKNQHLPGLLTWLQTIVGVACLVLTTFWITSWAMQGPGVAWQAYSDQVLQQAAREKKPVIMGYRRLVQTFPRT